MTRVSTFAANQNALMDLMKAQKSLFDKIDRIKYKYETTMLGCFSCCNYTTVKVILFK